MQKSALKPMKFKLELDLKNYLYDAKCCLACSMCKHGDWIYAPSPDVFD